MTTMGSAISIYPIAHMHRVNKSGKVPIVLRIDYNSQPAAYDSVGEKAYKVPVECWDPVKREVSKAYQNAAMINIAISKRALELETMFLLKEAAGVKLNKQKIKFLVKGIDPGKCFYEFSRNQIKEKYDNKETRRTYTTEVTKLEQFRAEASFADIDFEFLQSYKAWMRDIRKNKPNTIWKAFKFMNTMMNDALKIKGIIDENPFETFERGRYFQGKRPYLLKSEREKIEKLLYKELPTDLYKTVVYFLFMCYAGLRFEDAMSFDYNEHIIEGERLVMVTDKEDEPINIKLFPKLREVVVFVKDNPLVMANGTFNKLLKVVAIMAGIKKNLSAHVGRHSFGRMLAENGIDKSKAQKMLGHRDKRSTDIYYHLVDEDIDKEIDEKLNNV
jgi:site-specific recombinase XerD